MIRAIAEAAPALLVAFGLALSWNLTPLVDSFAKATDDPASNAPFWAPAVGYLHTHLTPGYRVEAVDTAGHWAAVYLPRAGIPLARGWFRQDDFPENKLLYSRLGPRAYQEWLRSLGVRYVVYWRAPVDYSARGEERLLIQGRSGLRPVMGTDYLAIYELPGARPILTGPGHPSVLALTQARVVVRLDRPGVYRLAIRYSPYWKSSAGCVLEGKDRMIRLAAKRAALAVLSFDIDAGRALRALAGTPPSCR